MNRMPLYSTNATLFNTVSEDSTLEPAVIRPPIRAAYDTQQKYDEAVQIGINYARKYDIEYIDHY